jgi:hypothetical protein
VSGEREKQSVTLGRIACGGDLQFEHLGGAGGIVLGEVQGVSRGDRGAEGRVGFNRQAVLHDRRIEIAQALLIVAREPEVDVGANTRPGGGTTGQGLCELVQAAGEADVVVAIAQQPLELGQRRRVLRIALERAHVQALGARSVGKAGQHDVARLDVGVGGRAILGDGVGPALQEIGE